MKRGEKLDKATRNRYHHTDWKKHSKKRKETANKYRRSHPEKVSKWNRKQMFKRRYGITEDIYNEMLHDQLGVCYICHTAPGIGPRKGLVIDHNHSTKKVRKLLCQPCNLILGACKENTRILYRCVKYLEEHA